MTLDDVASMMRTRFTNTPGGRVEITTEEWAVLADAIYLRDALVGITDAPESQSAKDKVATMLARHRRV